MWQSFIKELLGYCTLQVRITDDILDIENWGIEKIRMEKGIVTTQTTVSKGAYHMPNMVGWASQQVIEWTQYENPLGAHPQQFNEIFGAPVEGQVGIDYREVYGSYNYDPHRLSGKDE